MEIRGFRIVDALGKPRPITKTFRLCCCCNIRNHSEISNLKISHMSHVVWVKKVWVEKKSSKNGTLSNFSFLKKHFVFMFHIKCDKWSFQRDIWNLLYSKMKSHQWWFPIAAFYVLFWIYIVMSDSKKNTFNIYTCWVIWQE